MDALDDNDSLKEKLRDSLLISQKLLDIEKNALEGMRYQNDNFQNTLTDVLEVVREALPLFQNLEAKLTPEENTLLIKFATVMMAGNEKLFEQFKFYKKLEEKMSDDLSGISNEILAFTRS